MQATPSTLLYSQAIALLLKMKQDFAAGTVQSPTDIAGALTDILTRFDQSAGQPLLNFDYFEQGEPPITPKMNAIWGDVQLDVTILQNQIDILNAATLFTNNIFVTQLLNSSNKNASLSNKLDSLELFATDSSSDNLVVFSDSFGNSQLIDTSFLPPNLQASVQSGVLMLSPQGALVDLSTKSTVTILPTSNGFLGNNQEIEDPSVAPIDPTTQHPLYEFVAQVTPANDIKSLTDGDPTTWIEYEYCKVTAAQRASAENLNFTYQVISNNPASNSNLQQVDWATGPPSGSLEFDVQFDIGSIQPINYVTYSPYGLTNNTNNPVVIKELKTSKDGTTWNPIASSNVSVGTNTNSSSLRTAPTYTLGDLVWSFAETQARYVSISIVQSNPINVNVGHIYYLDQDHNRQEGPIPATNNLTQYYNPNYFASGSLTQYREYFPGERWAIGIQDISIKQIHYQTQSSMVTDTLEVGGTVNRIALDADVWIPPDFDTTQSWVNFFVSPDDGQNWFQLNDIENTSLGIPAVISFNDPLPAPFQDPGVKYYTVSGTVTSLRFKIELNTPNNKETPLVRSYALKVTKR